MEREGEEKTRKKPTSLKAWLSNNLFILSTGIHPTIISESFQKALDKGIEVLTNMAQPVELSDRETLLNSATTSLNSKVWLILQLCTSRLAEPFSFSQLILLFTYPAYHKSNWFSDIGYLLLDRLFRKPWLIKSKLKHSNWISVWNTWWSRVLAVSVK